MRTSRATHYAILIPLSLAAVLACGVFASLVTQVPRWLIYVELLAMGVLLVSCHRARAEQPGRPG